MHSPSSFVSARGARVSGVAVREALTTISSGGGSGGEGEATAGSTAAETARTPQRRTIFTTAPLFSVAAPR